MGGAPGTTAGEHSLPSIPYTSAYRPRSRAPGNRRGKGAPQVVAALCDDDPSAGGPLSRWTTRGPGIPHARGGTARREGGLEVPWPVAAVRSPARGLRGHDSSPREHGIAVKMITGDNLSIAARRRPARVARRHPRCRRHLCCRRRRPVRAAASGRSKPPTVSRRSSPSTSSRWSKRCKPGGISWA